MDRLLLGLKFYLGFAPTFSRRGFERKGLSQRPVAADFSGQTWLVTGASGGIGREITLQAARRGANVIAAARSAEKLEALAGSADGPGDIEPLVVDLSLMGELREATESIGPRRVDVLVNNVGVLLNQFSLTDEGFESSFATNLLSHFLLTETMIDRGRFESGSVVINMSSGGMYSTPLVPDDLNVTDPDRHDGVMAYARHKRAQVELTHWWNARFGPEIAFHVMHPGWVDTEGVRTSLPGFRRFFGPLLRNAEQGADTAIWLAAERPAVATEGIWLDRELRPEHVSDRTRTDANVREDMVRRLEAWTGSA
jgi:NAD(P)-dependent dehydrogenase (short-subunit alcohol dehydrogenase family)